MAAAKKKFAAKSKDIDFVIKVKDEDGKIVEFETDEVVVAVPKKKKKVAKTVRAEAPLGAASIEAEDTLAMIKNALKSGSMNKMMEEFEAADAATVPKKKKVTKKKTAEPKMPALEDTDEVKEATLD